MALTKVSRGLLSTSIVDNGNATAITIDSSENVGIGTGSPTLSAAWNKVLHVQSAGAGSSIRLADSTSGTSGDVGLLIGQYSNSSYIINRDSSNMYFWTGGQERVRIDSSGNLLVGTTDDVVWNNSANSAADNGHNLRDDGRAGFAYYNATANSNATVNINRTGSDGDLIRLFKSGSTVGSIGAAAGNLYIVSNDVGLNFAGGNDGIYPATANGAQRDAAIDLGHSSHRFKDLWLSGASYIPDVRSTGTQYFTHTTDVRFRTSSGTERMRIDSGGNLLVGRTSASFGSDTGIVFRPNNDSYIITDGTTGLTIRRNNSDGDMIQFYRDGSLVGRIGSRIGSGITLDSGATTDGLLKNNGAESYGWASGYFYPRVDNSKDLGLSVLRWDDVYATNGTINTSDRNEKQDIAELSDAEQRVAVAAKGLLRKFRWKDSVAEKGDEARTHFGIIAQDLQAAFAAEGLDAGDYAMFISSTWTDEETNEEKTRMGVRYSELLAFIIAAI